MNLTLLLVIVLIRDNRNRRVSFSSLDFPVFLGTRGLLLRSTVGVLIFTCFVLRFLFVIVIDLSLFFLGLIVVLVLFGGLGDSSLFLWRLTGST
jgi:hypothetical protein